MEPADLNSSRDDAQLEVLLRRPSPPLADNGFSARVLAALPATSSSPPVANAHRLRLLCCALAGAIGAAIALVAIAVRPPTSPDISAAFAEVTRSANLLLDPNLSIALTVTAVCLVYVFRPWTRLSSW